MNSEVQANGKIRRAKNPTSRPDNRIAQAANDVRVPHGGKAKDDDRNRFRFSEKHLVGEPLRHHPAKVPVVDGELFGVSPPDGSKHPLRTQGTARPSRDAGVGTNPAPRRDQARPRDGWKRAKSLRARTANAAQDFAATAFPGCRRSQIRQTPRRAASARGPTDRPPVGDRPLATRTAVGTPVPAPRLSDLGARRESQLYSWHDSTHQQMQRKDFPTGEATCERGSAIGPRNATPPCFAPDLLLLATLPEDARHDINFLAR